MYYVITILFVIILFFLYGIITSSSLILQVRQADVGVTVTIGQVSDVHFRRSIDVSYYEGSITELNSYHPDIIVFTGDLFQENNITEELKQDAIRVLSMFDATYKYAVMGNHDYYLDDKKIQTIDILQAAGFTVLINDHEVISVNDQEINIVGLDDLMLGNDQYETVLQTTFSYAYNIVLSHEPDTFHTVAPYPVNVMFSGHSHGGQIRLPYLPTLIKVKGAKDYPNRYYHEHDSTMFVSYGAGQSFLDIRMYNPPAIQIYQCS